MVREQTCTCCAVTKWTRACDKRLARLISYIHHTAQQCRPGLIQDTDFAGDLEDSKSTSGGLWCIFGRQTFVPISSMCKKQASVLHSSTEAVIISLDAGSRMDGIPALGLWDLVVEVFHSSPNHFNNTKDQVRGNLSRNTTSNKHTQNQTKVSTQHDIFVLINVDHFPSNSKFLDLARCCTCSEDNEAVSKNHQKRKSNNERHPEPRELLLVGCLTELIWTPRFNSSTSKPNTNLETS